LRKGEKMVLTYLQQGESAKVLHIHNRISERLRDIGLIEGTAVKCMQKAPSGDPVAYLIRGAVIALRSEDSSCVEVAIRE